MKNILLFFLLIQSIFGISQNQKLDSAWRARGLFVYSYSFENSYKVLKRNDTVVSKHIETDLFEYKANYEFGTRSFIEAKLNLVELFDTINPFLDAVLKENLEIEIPSFQFQVSDKYGYSYVYNIRYKNERITIFRDCGCGTHKGMRINGGRFSGYNNQLFSRNIKFDLKSRYRYGKSQEPKKMFDFKTEKGLLKEFISYSDTNIVDKKILFENGMISEIEAYYPNGEKMYQASIIRGRLQGDFVYWDERGNEKLIVNFYNNEIIYFH